MKEIKLTRGMVALVDDEDFDFINQWKWNAPKSKNTCYAKRNVWLKNSKEYISVSMHRTIMNVSMEMVVDHIDHNGLNNQKSNLRICTGSQNGGNSISKGGSSMYKGVCWYKSKNKWIAYITYNYKRYHLGYFKLEETAARVYDEAAKKYFGEFAHLNY